MNSHAYEELCRRFLAQQLGIPTTSIRSGTLPGSVRPGQPQMKNQIDLYWEVSNEVATYLTIANAKWRSSDKVDQGEVMLLEQARESVGAHKAVMICPTEFTEGAVAAAKQYGIALHVFSPRIIVVEDEDDVAEGEGIKPTTFTHRVINKGMGRGDWRTQ